MLYSIASSVYSLFYTVISVSKDKTYHIINKEPDETTDVGSDYVIIKRMRDKPLTESIYEHITAPFISATKIDNTIYLGNAFNAADYNYIKNNGITAIVNASKEISNYFETNSDLQYFKLDDVKDINSSSIKKYFDNFISFVKKIKAENGRILIHCFMGSSRSAILVVLCKVYFLGDKLEDSIIDITNKRERVNINITFVKELKEYLYKKNYIY